MSACAEHVQYQLPNKCSRVGFLIDAIQCVNTGLQAAMASVKMDNGLHGLQNNFEAAVSQRFKAKHQQNRGTLTLS